MWLVGCGSDGGTSRATEFTAGDVVTVSESSPFAECSADADPDATHFPGSEVEREQAFLPSVEVSDDGTVGLASAGSDFFALPSITTDGDPADTVLIPIRGR